MVRFEPLKYSDISFVIENLWERGKQELSHHGKMSMEAVMEHLAIAAAHNDGYVMRVEDEPVAVFGAMGKNGHYYSWFLATERFDEVGKTATRLLRGFIKEKVTDRPDATLEMASAGLHPDTERWFDVIGFVKLPPKEGEEKSPFTRYTYDRQKQLTRSPKC